MGPAPPIEASLRLCISDVISFHGDRSATSGVTRYNASNENLISILVISAFFHV
jgi:hypothetical protein